MESKNDTHQHVERKQNQSLPDGGVILTFTIGPSPGGITKCNPPIGFSKTNSTTTSTGFLSVQMFNEKNNSLVRYSKYFLWIPHSMIANTKQERYRAQLLISCTQLPAPQLASSCDISGKTIHRQTGLMQGIPKQVKSGISWAKWKASNTGSSLERWSCYKTAIHMARKPNECATDCQSGLP